MPIVYLNNLVSDTCSYSGGGDSKYYINILIDEIIPYLNTAGVSYVKACSRNFRNNFNNKRCNLYLSITSGDSCNLINKDANKENINIFYVEGNSDSKRAANIFSGNFNVCKLGIDSAVSKIDPDKNNVCKNAPLILVHLGPHCSEFKSKWIRENTENIAQNLSLSIVEFFAIPFCGVQKSKKYKCKCNTSVMDRPNLNCKVLSVVPKDSVVNASGQWEDWYIISCEKSSGYIHSKYLSPQG